MNSYIEYNSENHSKNYLMYRVSPVKENDILFYGDSIEGYISSRVYYKKFNYKTVQERVIIIHALSQIPISLVEYSSFKDFDINDIQLIDNDLLSITKNFTNSAVLESLEPILPYYTHGYYRTCYNKNTKKYSFNILYSEGLGIKEDACINIHAIDFDTEKELFDFIKKARSFGLNNFLPEKKEKEWQNHLTKMNNQKAKENILLSMF